MAKNQRKNGLTAVVLLSIAGGMVGLAFASVPLYQLFCQVTGYGGTPKTGADVQAAESKGQADKRMITVRFDANVNSSLPWRFQPLQKEITLQGGEQTLAHYSAQNISDRDITGTASFNVTPYKAAIYFNKIDCFCFTEQKLEPGQVASMPVSFYVDPEIFDDPNTREVKTITLSYTFYRVKQEKDGKGKLEAKAASNPPAEKERGS